ncbi:MAG: MBL fold metallo-hydrolase [Gammaproteobacteria bacterium]|nr:MBL fold metallo-hydrolase [Gammaproteobacteria bacterium]
MRNLINYFIYGVSLSGLLFTNIVNAYTPKAEKVTENVYAFIGPLGQRSEENQGLNNNLGFVITKEGVILIDSGASYLGAQSIENAIAEVTDMPVKWVINTGSQDHRWLGNDYFSSRGAEIIAMQKTAATQLQHAEEQMQRMEGFLNNRFKGTHAKPANRLLSDQSARISLGGEELELHYTDAHYPGDVWVWLPKQSVVFTGDLVYVDRIFSVLPWSSVVNGQKAFHELVKLNPDFIVPGHGSVSDIAKARRDCGDYYDFLVDKIGAAAQEMESMQDVMKRYDDLPAFKHLENYGSLHRTNMNRTYLEFEQL